MRLNNPYLDKLHSYFNSRKIFYFLHLFTILIVFFFSEKLGAGSVYFPSDLKPNFRKKIEHCVLPSLPAYEFQKTDIHPSRLKQVFSSMSKRAKLEGRYRAKSILCLRKLNLTEKEKEDMNRALDSLFAVEVMLFLNYSRFLDQATGIDRSLNSKFLKSRYDLMIIIQTKTKDWVLDHEDEYDSDLEKDFSNLYLSVLRTYYDFYIEMDPSTMDRFFKFKEG